MTKTQNVIERGDIAAIQKALKVHNISYQTVYRRVAEGRSTSVDNLIDHAMRDVVAKRRISRKKLNSTVFGSLPFVHELNNHFKSILIDLDQFYKAANKDSLDEVEQVVLLSESEFDWLWKNCLLQFVVEKCDGIEWALKEVEEGHSETSLTFEYEFENELFTYKILVE